MFFKVSWAVKFGGRVGIFFIFSLIYFFLRGVFGICFVGFFYLWVGVVGSLDGEG